MYNKCVYICIAFTYLLFSCNTNSDKNLASLNTDSVKNIILNINDKMTEAVNDKVHGSATYRSFCADTIMAGYDNEFSTSPTDVSGYLFGLREKPHDFTFMLFDKTALLSYLERFFEPFDKDTLMQYLRVTKTFVLISGKWKMVTESSALQPVNYFSPVINKNQIIPASYAGHYKWSDGLTDTLFIREEKLYSTNADDPPQINYMVSDSTYMMKNDFGRKIFNRDKNGEVISYTYLKFDGQKVRAMKIK
jgi:hypothetical protein